MVNISQWLLHTCLVAVVYWNIRIKNVPLKRILPINPFLVVENVLKIIYHLLTFVQCFALQIWDVYRTLCFHRLKMLPMLLLLVHVPLFSLLEQFFLPFLVQLNVDGCILKSKKKEKRKDVKKIKKRSKKKIQKKRSKNTKIQKLTLVRNNRKVCNSSSSRPCSFAHVANNTW